jgi:hypothetical protein
MGRQSRLALVAAPAARMVAMSAPRSIGELLADPTSRVSEIYTLVMLATHISEAIKQAESLRESIPLSVRDALLKALRAAEQHSDAATMIHAAEEKGGSG